MFGDGNELCDCDGQPEVTLKLVFKYRLVLLEKKKKKEEKKMATKISQFDVFIKQWTHNPLTKKINLSHPEIPLPII